jgi:hypothetical protein
VELVGRECSPIVESEGRNSEPINPTLILYNPWKPQNSLLLSGLKIVSGMIGVFLLDSSYLVRFAGCASTAF